MLGAKRKSIGYISTGIKVRVKKMKRSLYNFSTFSIGFGCTWAYLLSTSKYNAPRYFVNIAGMMIARDLRFSPSKRAMWEKYNNTKMMSPTIE
jgi:hypothetical protein